MKKRRGIDNRREKRRGRKEKRKRRGRRGKERVGKMSGQSNATILGSKSTPTVLRKISEPMIPKRSNSEVQLKKQMPQKSLSSVQLMKQKSLGFIHESEPLGLQSHSDNSLDQTHSMKTGEDRGTLAEEDSEITNLGSANPQEGHVLFTTNGEDSFSKTTHHGLEEKGTYFRT